jgi:Lon-like protease
MPVRRLVALLILVFAVFGAAILSRGDIPCEVLASQPACYVALAPGPVEDSLSIVDVDGAETFPAMGELLLTTISVQDSLRLTTWLQSVTSSSTDTVPREQVFPTGVDRDELRDRNLAAMADSQLTATIAGLTEAGYELTGDGARIVLVTEDAVTDELLEDDVIVAVGPDRQPIEDSGQVVEAVQANAPGDRLELHIERAGQEQTIDVTLGASPEDPDVAFVGVLLMTEIDLPVDIDIDAGSIGGPSAGMIFALTIVELLGEDDLTGGHVVAGTGTIDRDGIVGPVGGVRQKVIGATDRRDGQEPATVFLVPSSNVDDARGAPVRRDITVVPVDDLTDALNALAVLRDGGEPEGSLLLSAGG